MRRAVTDVLVVFGFFVVVGFAWVFLCAAVTMIAQGTRGWLRQALRDVRDHPTAKGRREARRIRRVRAATCRAIERIERVAAR